MAEGVKRKISAILSADVVGYSKLMGEDEETTVRTMESYRETISSLIEQHDGHVIDSPGDNLLSEFGSVVDSVQCAVEIQHVIKAKNAGFPKPDRWSFVSANSSTSRMCWKVASGGPIVAFASLLNSLRQ